MKKKLVLVFLLPAFFLFAQEKPLPEQPNEVEKTSLKNAINAIKNGALIVQLPTRTKKLNKMREVLNNPNTDANSKERLQLLIDKTEQTTANDNRLLVENLHKIYTFSKFYVLYDTEMEAFEKGSRKGIFLNEKMEIDPSIELTEKEYCFLMEGLTSSGTQNYKNSLEAFIILNQNKQRLINPFPYYYRINSLKYTVNSIFDKKNAKGRHLGDIVKKLNVRLKEYHYQAN